MEVVPPKRRAPPEGRGERAWAASGEGEDEDVIIEELKVAEEPPYNSTIPGITKQLPGQRSFQLDVPFQR